MTDTVDGQPAANRPVPPRTDTTATTSTSPTGAGEPTKPRSSGRTRDPFFDNAKFVAILLVVIGHVIEDLRDVEALAVLYMYIYMFHMPVFIVITGYFSRNFTFSGGKAKKLITNLAVPYVVFEIAYSTYSWAADGNDLEFTLLDPYYLTWFLMALFAWRLSTPVWQQIRWPLAVAVVISLLSGMNELPRELDMNRMLGMLPFFVLGLMLKPEHFEWLKRPAARVIGALVMIGGLATAFVVRNHMTTEWVYWRHGNDWFNVDDATGSLMRLGMLVCSSTLVAAFLALIPATERWFTRFGSLTLYTYLLHGFFTKGMEYLNWYDFAWMRTVWGIPLVILGCIALALLLMSPPVRWLTRWALEPRMAWAFTTPRRPRHRVHRGAHRAPPKTSGFAAIRGRGQQDTGPTATAADGSGQARGHVPAQATGAPVPDAGSAPEQDGPRRTGSSPTDRDRPLDSDPLGGATVTIAHRDPDRSSDAAAPNYFAPASEADDGTRPTEARRTGPLPPPPPQNPLPTRAATTTGPLPPPPEPDIAPRPEHTRAPYDLSAWPDPESSAGANERSATGDGEPAAPGADADPGVGTDSGVGTDPAGDADAPPGPDRLAGAEAPLDSGDGSVDDGDTRGTNIAAGPGRRAGHGDADPVDTGHAGGAGDAGDVGDVDGDADPGELDRGVAGPAGDPDLDDRIPGDHDLGDQDLDERDAGHEDLDDAPRPGPAPAAHAHDMKPGPAFTGDGDAADEPGIRDTGADHPDAPAVDDRSASAADADPAAPPDAGSAAGGDSAVGGDSADDAEPPSATGDGPRGSA